MRLLGLLKRLPSPNIAPDNKQTQNRYERKYLTTAAKAVSLEQRLRVLAFPDAHNILGGYLVSSLYFDDRQNTSFQDKLNGEFQRNIVRLRMYNHDDRVIRLECKKKVGDMHKKTSMFLSRDQADCLISGDYGFLLSDKDETSNYFYLLFSRGLSPVSIVRYRRRAYRWVPQTTRITLDTDIEIQEPPVDFFNKAFSYIPIVVNPDVVLEVKSSSETTRHVSKLLRGCCDTRLAFSKYANSRYSLLQYY